MTKHHEIFEENKIDIVIFKKMILYASLIKERNNLNRHCVI